MTFNNRIVYTEDPIDRASLLRKNKEWIAEQINARETRVLVLWQNKSLVQSHTEGNTILINLNGQLAGLSHHLTFLGVEEHQSVFCLDLSEHDEEEALKLVTGGEFHNLRGASSTLKPNEASLLAYALGLSNWKKSYQFCYRCGAKLDYQETGHVKVCTNYSCGHTTYPRTDPAVIVLIEHRPSNGEPASCLLAKHKRYKGKMVSTLAGFVEPGESLEHAVKREMMEEVGVEVDNIRYLGSQPWPFPASLMLGFIANSNSKEIKLDDDEIADAQWYTAEELMTKSASGEIVLSGKDSIARFMINQWIQANKP